ncbi:UNVERIFIED_CONTAM: hypothetical protein FKN15_051794 [Acipenser sinensis]
MYEYTSSREFQPSSEEAKKPEDEVTELPEDFFTPENTSIVFNLETNDSDTSKSSKTSVESLEDQKNENNNNSVAGRLASNSSCNPFYGNPSFSVVTYRKNESSLESERSVWKTNFCLDDSQTTNYSEDVIGSVKIAPTVYCVYAVLREVGVHAAGCGSTSRNRQKQAVRGPQSRQRMPFQLRGKDTHNGTKPAGPPRLEPDL